MFLKILGKYGYQAEVKFKDKGFVFRRSFRKYLSGLHLKKNLFNENVSHTQCALLFTRLNRDYMSLFISLTGLSYTNFDSKIY